MDNIVRGGNWFFDTLNTWRVLDTVKLSDLTRVMDQFAPGGHMMAAEFPENFNPLSFEIDLKNDDPRIRGLCGREPGDWTTATYYENLISYRTGQTKGRIISVKGLVNSVRATQRRGMKAAGTSYNFSTIVSYIDTYNGEVVHKFDLFAGPGATIVNGVQVFAAMAANLAISGGTAL